MELSSRRFVNLVLCCLREGLPPDGLERMDRAIESSAEVRHPWLEPTQSSGQPAAPKPPPGWRSDHENWAGIQGFLGQMTSVKGAVSREKVKSDG